jgi:hypothetical protein
VTATQQPCPQQSCSLRVPQARVLAALVPDDPTDPPSEWPLLTRAQLGIRAGYTGTSGSITRTMNGLREGSSSGNAHPGLLGAGLVEAIEIDVDGLAETNYRITAAGIAAYQAHVAATGGKLPEVKSAALCVNNRYRSLITIKNKVGEVSLDVLAEVCREYREWIIRGDAEHRAECKDPACEARVCRMARGLSPRNGEVK